jgi:hypothetical protein
MADTTQIAGSPRPQAGTYNPIAASSFPVGTAVTPLSGGRVGPANAGSVLGASTSGIAVTPGVEGQSVNVRFSGLVTLTVEEWNAVTGGTEGLFSASNYYISDSVDGRITFSRPLTPGSFVTQIGLALSDTDFLVQIGPAEQIV